MTLHGTHFELWSVQLDPVLGQSDLVANDGDFGVGERKQYLSFLEKYFI